MYLGTSCVPRRDGDGRAQVWRQVASASADEREFHKTRRRRQVGGAREPRSRSIGKRWARSRVEKPSRAQSLRRESAPSPDPATTSNAELSGRNLPRESRLLLKVDDDDGL